MTNLSPWVKSRGLGRLLAQETNISDLLQFLSDRDSGPWVTLVGFAPTTVEREAPGANRADLLLTAPGDAVVLVEMKLGHIMDVNQQENYEGLAGQPELYLAALNADRVRLEETRTGRWSFLSLTRLFSAWTNVEDEDARVLARQVVSILQDWDAQISAVLKSSGEDEAAPLSILTEKFLARVVTRRIANDLVGRGLISSAGVSSGGGTPLVQAWAPIRGEGADRCFMAEVRWWGTKSGGELRFGVDFRPLSGEPENEEIRRSAYGLSLSMEEHIDFASLKSHLMTNSHQLGELLYRDTNSRPEARGDWETILRLGFAGAPLTEDNKRNGRQQTRPAFYGDGALRFQAIASVNFDLASARDVGDLLEETIAYLASVQPRQVVTVP